MSVNSPSLPSKKGTYESMAAKKVIQSEFAQPERLSRSSNYDVIFHFKGVGVSTASLKTA